MSRMMLAAGAALLIVAGGAPALADVKAGVDAWSRGDYKKAVEEWRPAAIAGDADAQFNLGQAYKLGRGVPTDLALAEEWYRKAALQGHYQAQENYGLALFQNGKRAEAVEWLERAVARGEPRAQLVLGTMLFNGDSVAKDWVRAYALLTRSSAAGLPQAAQTLGQMDQYIPSDVRQKGILLARQYEAEAQRPPYTPEVAGQGSGAMKGADLPASTYATDGDARPSLTPSKPPVASRPLPTRPTPPAAVVDMPPPTTRPIAGRGWRVQFGAFRDEGNARGLWQQLQGKVGGLAGLQPYLVRSGTLTKLQAGPIGSSAEATRLCGEVKARAAGTPCVLVAP
ncbi:MAG: sporulation protein [Sphingomonas sp. 28-66-16]|nr:MAG: sporulation protein [Sphingomonas sp. 28-66-16]